MTLRQLLDLFDNWMQLIKLNDNKLRQIEAIDTIANVVDNGKHLNDEVVSFGFYDGQLCVRIDAIDL